MVVGEKLEPDVQKGLLADLIARVVVALGVMAFVAACGYRLVVEVRPFLDRFAGF